MSEEEYLHTGMMDFTKETLSARRDELLSMLGLSWKEYAMKDMLDMFTDNERKYQKELNAIDFLLADEDDKR
jgi:hypothetical protein